VKLAWLLVCGCLGFASASGTALGAERGPIQAVVRPDRSGEMGANVAREGHPDEPSVTVTRRGVAVVICRRACSIVVTIRTRRRHVSFLTSLRGPGERRIRPSRRALAWFGRRPALLTVSVEGTTRARRTVVLL
jgi:hypothetical protein